jgi:hypothetical protein
MTARRSTYLDIYAARTPGHDVRPGSWLPGIVVVLAMTLMALLVLAPDVVSAWVDSARDALASLG